MSYSPPSKRSRLSCQKYRQEYTTEWPFIKTSQISDSHAYCEYCRTDFSVKHGGRHDCIVHVGTKKHQQFAKSIGNHKSMREFVVSTGEDNAVIKAETLFANFIVEHNLPIAVSDHIGPLCKAAFPDSNIANKYGSGRTKTTAIIETLSNDTSKSLALELSLGYFSLSTDGSSDTTTSQLYPVVVRYYDGSLGKIVTQLLSLPAMQEVSSTGENIFNLLNRNLEKFNIPWQRCVSFCCDNASVMVGVHKGVAAFVRKENENVYVQGCPCHLVHLAAQYAAAKLPLSVEDLLIDLYYYFDKSSKRNKQLKQLQQLCDIETRGIIKHVNTR